MLQGACLTIRCVQVRAFQTTGVQDSSYCVCPFVRFLVRTSQLQE